MVVFVGVNGVGKINILEVILFLIVGCGLWCVVFGDIVCVIGDGLWSVLVCILFDEVEIILGIGVIIGIFGCKVCIDGEDICGLECFFDYMCIFWFVLVMDGFFIGLGLDCWRFFDCFIFVIDLVYGCCVSDFEIVLWQCN